MLCLFVGSTGNRAGQSLVTWALACDLRARGLRVSFLKPLFPSQEGFDPSHGDPDGMLFKQVLDLPEPMERICPVMESSEPYGRSSAEDLAEQLRPLLEERSSQVDVLLVMGSPKVFLDEPSLPASDISLAQALGAGFLLVSRHLDLPRTVYSVLSVRSLLGAGLKAVVLNRVGPHQVDEVWSAMRQRLGKRAMPPIMIVPEDPLLSSLTLAQVVEAAGGEFLLGQERAQELVSGWSMGASQLLSGELAVFKRVYNRVVLMGAQEPGQETAPRPVGVLLTSGRRPPPVLFEVARRIDLPLVLVAQDTFSTLDRLERYLPSLTPMEAVKARRMVEFLGLGGKLKELWSSLGI